MNMKRTIGSGFLKFSIKTFFNKFKVLLKPVYTQKQKPNWQGKSAKYEFDNLKISYF